MRLFKFDHPSHWTAQEPTVGATASDGKPADPANSHTPNHRNKKSAVLTKSRCWLRPDEVPVVVVTDEREVKKVDDHHREDGEENLMDKKYQSERGN
jgi:hypothetical protein